MIKKHLVWAALCLATATVAIATPRLIPVDEINAEIAKLLAPNNNASTQLDATVKVAELNELRAVRFAGEVNVAKVNKVAATLRLKYNYAYPEAAGSLPELKLSGAIGAKDGALAKILANVGLLNGGVDKFFVDVQKAITQLASDMLKDYGASVTVDTNVSNVKKDKDNHFVSETVQLHVAIDLTKLPKNIKPESVMFSDLNLLVDLDLSKGAEIAGRVVMNPGYESFKTDQQGLKEILEKLEKKDKETLSSLAEMATMANNLMDQATGK